MTTPDPAAHLIGANGTTRRLPAAALYAMATALDTSAMTTARRANQRGMSGPGLADQRRALRDASNFAGALAGGLRAFLLADSDPRPTGSPADYRALLAEAAVADSDEDALDLMAAAEVSLRAAMGELPVPAAEADRQLRLGAQ
jgi:hypothetical protein